MKKGTNKPSKIFRKHPAIGRLVRLTAGRRHAYYEATLEDRTFLVRKPCLPSKVEEDNQEE